MTATPPSAVVLTLPQALEQASACLSRGEHRSLIELCSRILTTFPQQPDALALLALSAAIGFGNVTIARQLSRQAAEAYVSQAREQAKAGNRDGALAAYRRSVVLEPDLSYSYFSIGELRTSYNQLPEAIDAFEHSMRLNPQYIPVQIWLADLYGALNLWSECATQARAGVLLLPDAAVHHYQFSIACHHLGANKTALTEIRRALALDPSRSAYHLLQGLILLRDQGDVKSALAAFRSCLALDPERSEALFNIALCTRILGLSLEALPENAAYAERQRLLAEAATTRQQKGDHYLKAIAVRPDRTDFAEAHGRLIAEWKATMIDETIALEQRNVEWVITEAQKAEVAYRRLSLSHPRYAGVAGCSPRPTRQPRVWDCFMFSHELDLLELRLSELADVADRFVLVESPWTHLGEPKELVFQANRERFAAFADRIVHVIADIRQGSVPHAQDVYQRTCIARGLEQAEDDDIVVVADLDEIPDHRVIAGLRADHKQASRLNVLAMRQNTFFVNFTSTVAWIRPVALPWGLARHLGVNEARHVTLRGGPQILPVIPDAGWHFSWLGGIDAVWHKLRKMCPHIELLDHTPTKEALRQKMIAGDFSIFSQKFHGRFIEIDDSFPRWLRERKDRLQEMNWSWPPAELMTSGEEKGNAP